jgi:hypothetical protein
MQTVSRIGVLACIVIVMVAASPVTSAVDHEEICGFTGPTDGQRIGHDVAILIDLDDDTSTSAGQLAVAVHADGDADAHGAVLLWPLAVHDRPVALIAHEATAACADTNGDGIAGLIRLLVSFVDVESGDSVLGVITPADGHEIIDIGDATLQLNGERVASVLDVVVRWIGRPLSAGN